jgi:hypothetical protein
MINLLLLLFFPFSLINRHIWITCCYNCSMEWLQNYIASAAYLQSCTVLDMTLIGSSLWCLLIAGSSSSKDDATKLSLYVVDLCEKKRQADISSSDDERGVTQLLLKEKIGHEVAHLCVSKRGTYLALYGTKGLSVLPLPDLYRLKKGYRQLELPCFEIDPNIYRHVTLKKLLWHPLSLDDAHLMILSSDDTIRMYHISRSLDIPEQIFTPLQKYIIPKTLRKSIFSSGHFAVDSDDEQLLPEPHISGKVFRSEAHTHIVSFSLGHSIYGWKKITLYYLLDSGDIYCLCPILPYYG